MPAPKMPEMPSGVSAGRAAEILDEFFTSRPGWTSTEHGWMHKKTGITVEARSGVQPFRVTRKHTSGETFFGSRAGLDLHLCHAGA